MRSLLYFHYYFYTSCNNQVQGYIHRVIGFFIIHTSYSVQICLVLPSLHEALFDGRAFSSRLSLVAVGVHHAILVIIVVAIIRFQPQPT